MFQLEFRDVQLYDDTKSEKEPHTTDVLAVRFFGNVFAVFLDNLEEDVEKPWYDRLYDDEIPPFSCGGYELGFDCPEYAEEVYGIYRNKAHLTQLGGVDAFSAAKHLIAGKCGDVGFIVGGDRLAVFGKNGELPGEAIESLSKRWWEYWKHYWRRRGKPEAYQKDWACEVTIPADKINPQGAWD